jgi:carnitine O-acetyltransferase
MFLMFIVNDDDTAGFMGEHSMMDGTPTHRFNDTVCIIIAKNGFLFNDTNIRSNLPEPSPIKFMLNNDVKQAL